MTHEPSDADLMGVLDSHPDTCEFLPEKSGEMILNLDPPINGESRLTLKEPTVYQVKQAADVIGQRATSESVYDSQIILVSLVAACSTDMVNQLPTRKLDEAVAYVCSFEDDARRNMMDPEAFDKIDLSSEKIIVFPKPIEGGGRSFSEMKLHEPEVKDRRRFKAAEAGGSMSSIMRGEIQLVQDVSGWHPAAIMRMPISKFAEASDYLTGFFLGGQKAGKASPSI